MPHEGCYRLGPSSFDRVRVRRPTDLIDESLNGLLPPGSYSLLESMQLSLAVAARVTNLELNEQLERGLVRSILKTLHHLRPVVLEDISMTTSPLVVKHSVGFRADSYAASASV
jgi:hypothetical protein